MIRLVSMSGLRLVIGRSTAQFVGTGLGSAQVQLALVEGASEDRALDSLVFDRTQTVDVVDAGHAARRNDRPAQSPGQANRGVDVHPAQHAVAADVGLDDPPDT